MPIWDALVKCPTGVYVKRDFRWYEVSEPDDARRRARPLAPVEYYSIDEFFFVAAPPRGQSLQEHGRGDPRPHPGSGSACR